MAITIDGADNKLEIGANATGPSSLRLYEDTDNGTNYVSIIAPSAVTSNRTITLPDATGTLVTNSGSEAGAFSTLAVNSNNISAENSLGFRNRIINGDMRIDQRNAGASYTQTGAAGQYSLDRWNVSGDITSKFSVQQNAGSVTPPTGFTNYLGATSLSAYSVPVSEAYIIRQQIEGFNVADLAWGTASAKTVTLSFWVRSSLTGTFGGVLKNSGNNRSYPFTYTISAANTWEQETVTIAGDTSGTWLTNNGIGLMVIFSLGSGSSVSGTAGAWAASSLFSATGAVSVVGTNAATWYITGVQLEVGSVATPFERRDYGRELILCQRYYQKVLPAASSVNFASGFCSTTTSSRYVLHMITEMRAAPTALETTGTAADYTVNYVASATACSSVPAFATASKVAINFSADVASGFTAGVGALLRTANASAYLAWSAEL